MLHNKAIFNMASDWLAAVLPANHMPGLKIYVNWHGSFLITQASDKLS